MREMRGTSCWRSPVGACLPRRSRSLAVQPDEVLSDAGARSACPGAVARAALHGVPEPVDRRLRRAARPRSAGSRARAAHQGDSDEQVLDFLVARYGEFVLLKPPFEWHTAILWLTPLHRASRRRDRVGCGDSAPPRRDAATVAAQTPTRSDSCAKCLTKAVNNPASARSNKPLIRRIFIAAAEGLPQLTKV